MVEARTAMLPALFQAATLLLGSVLQSSAGFGFGMFAIPLLMATGLPASEAIVMTLGAVSIQTAYGSYLHRRYIEWGPGLRLLSIRALTMPLGTLLLGFAASTGGEQASQLAIGVVLVGLVVLRLAVHPRPKNEVAPTWGFFAGLASGVLSTFSGMGGPPLVLYALAHNWSPQRVRAFLWLQFLLAVPLIVAFFVYRFGLSVTEAYARGLLHFPLVWLGARLGLRLSSSWTRQGLERVAHLLLGCIALSTILRALAP